MTGEEPRLDVLKAIVLMEMTIRGMAELCAVKMILEMGLKSFAHALLVFAVSTTESMVLARDFIAEGWTNYQVLDGKISCQAMREVLFESILKALAITF